MFISHPGAFACAFRLRARARFAFVIEKGFFFKSQTKYMGHKNVINAPTEIYKHFLESSQYDEYKVITAPYR